MEIMIKLFIEIFIEIYTNSMWRVGRKMFEFAMRSRLSLRDGG